MEENKALNFRRMTGLLDEAKIMASVGGYHENIINLQGMTMATDLGVLSKVRMELTIGNS